MADLQIKIGAAISESVVQINKDIESIKLQVNKKPLQIKIGLSTSDIQSQINNLYKNIKPLKIPIQLQQTGSGNVNTGASGSSSGTSGRTKVLTDEAIQIKNVNEQYSRLMMTMKNLNALRKIQIGVDSSDTQRLNELNKSIAELETRYNGLKLDTIDNPAKNVLLNQKQIDDFYTKAELGEIRLTDAINKRNMAAKSSTNLDLVVSSDSIKKVDAGIAVLQSRIDKAKVSWSNILGDPKVIGQVKEIENSLKNITPGDDKALKAANKQWQLLSNNIAASSLNTKSFGDRVRETFARLSSYLVNVAVIGTITRSLREAFTDLKSIDSELTNLSKVTNVAREDFRKLSIEATEGASRWGRTAEDYLKAQTIFAQAGKENYEQLADLSILTQSAGDVESELASKMLVASDSAFQLSGNVEELTKIIDGQNNISNKSASSMSDIAEATTRYANTAAVAGESAQTMSALISAGVATTQRSGDVVGNALRTLTMNIRSIRGETEDGLIDEKSWGIAEAALKNIGIETRTVANGITELKTASQVLDELATKYETNAISAEQLSLVLENVGGKRQGDILAAMVQNWSVYEEQLKNYAEGTGSAAREATKDLESWDGKLNVLTNTWTGFVAKLLDTEIVKGGLDLGGGILGFFSSIIDSPIAGQITLITASMLGLGAALKSVTATQIGQGITNTFQSLATLNCRAA